VQSTLTKLPDARHLTGFTGGVISDGNEKLTMSPFMIGS
jgi:hypothetical protein